MKNQRFVSIILIVVLFFLTACQPQQPPDKVTLQLKWVHQAQFAGYYVALEKGYYAEENIELEILPGGPGVDYFQVLADGEADFSVVRPEGIFLERAAGNPVKAFATIFQLNPFLMVSLKESGIRSPLDFPGKTIALAGTDSDAQFNSMLYNAGVDPNSITVVPFTFDYDPFYAGEVDVMPSFAAGSLLDLQKTNTELNHIWPTDYDVHWYSDTLAAADSLLAEDPDLVLRFLRATLKGHQYLYNNLDEAAEICLKYADVQDREVQLGMLEATLPLMVSGGLHLGEMDPEVWEDMQQDLMDYGFLDEAIPIEDVMTLDILEKIYSEVE
jgi:NitT/TauT family transport system substrate-binding protein